jgi:hypothetical protein
MKPDAMLVEAEMISEALGTLSEKGLEKAFADLASSEPHLASYITHSLCGIAGKLALAGAPAEVVRGSHEDFLMLAVACLAALRRGHYHLWRDANLGSRLAEFDESLKAPPKRRKRSPGSAGA